MWVTSIVKGLKAEGISNPELLEGRPDHFTAGEQQRIWFYFNFYPGLLSSAGALSKAWLPRFFFSSRARKPSLKTNTLPLSCTLVPSCDVYLASGTQTEMGGGGRSLHKQQVGNLVEVFAADVCFLGFLKKKHLRSRWALWVPLQSLSLLGPQDL